MATFAPAAIAAFLRALSRYRWIYLKLSAFRFASASQDWKQTLHRYHLLELECKGDPRSPTAVVAWQLDRDPPCPFVSATGVVS